MILLFLFSLLSYVEILQCSMAVSDNNCSKVIFRFLVLKVCTLHPKYLWRCVDFDNKCNKYSNNGGETSQEEESTPRQQPLQLSNKNVTNYQRCYCIDFHIDVDICCNVVPSIYQLLLPQVWRLSRERERPQQNGNTGKCRTDTHKLTIQNIYFLKKY